MMPSARGFLLPLVAVLLTAAAALVLDGLRGAALDQALATSLRERQRGFEAAEIGLAEAQVRLSASPLLPREETVRVDDASSALVVSETVERDALPEGFSAGRLVAHRLRVRSTGSTARGTRITLEAGFTRLESLP